MTNGIQANLQHAVLRRINQLCKQRGWSYSRLAAEAGVSTRTVNYSITDFFDTAYFRNLPRE